MVNPESLRLGTPQQENLSQRTPLLEDPRTGNENINGSGTGLNSAALVPISWIDEMENIYSDKTKSEEERNQLIKSLKAKYAVYSQPQHRVQTANTTSESSDPQASVDFTSINDQSAFSKTKPQTMPNATGNYGNGYSGMNGYGNMNNNMNSQNWFGGPSMFGSSSILSNLSPVSHGISFIDSLPKVSENLFNLKKVWTHHELRQKLEDAKDSIPIRAPSIYDGNTTIGMIEEFFRHEYDSLEVSKNNVRPIRQYARRVYPRNEELAESLQDENQRNSLGCGMENS
ncbi:hypothetical protein GQ42DRAFT_157531 [Ramicandelaber brevisporus]|nr:hypothetical protein GQ42DRAFT_157531 [Ramicandelaber brevisporus]